MVADVTFVGAEFVSNGMVMMASAIVPPAEVWRVRRRMLDDDLFLELGRGARLEEEKGS